MQRAAVLIGVKKAGGLPELPAAWVGTHGMAAWARSQGIPDEDVVVITDETGPVQLRQIKDAVKELVDRSSVEQLLLYFSGHGINNARAEYWLLSEAIEDPDEAVNVTASEELARYCGISHVVFFSDACRTAASGIQAQRVTGGVVFPNYDGKGQEEQVDLFFGTSLGHPALEIEDINKSSGGYRAVYTETLLEALRGERRELAESAPGQSWHVVRPWPLKRYLRSEVPQRVFRATGRTQVPDARITSSPEAWIAGLTMPPRIRGLRPGGGPEIPLPSSQPRSPLESLTEGALSNARAPGPADFATSILNSTDHTRAEALAFMEFRTAAAHSFGPGHFKTGCGFKVSGTRVARAYVRGGSCKLQSDALVQIALMGGESENALLVLEDGAGVVLPALDGFLGALTFVRGDLVSVDYEPSDNSRRWMEFEARQKELKQLRAVAAAATAMGTFRMGDDEPSRRIARQMQVAKGIDPALSLYAAYAYRDQGRRPEIESMSYFQQADLSLVLFDVAMMSRRLRKDCRVLPFAPLLSQGWALIPAYGVELPEALRSIRSGVRGGSPWTLYDADCVGRIESAMRAGLV